ncbi:MAG TPA: hypothetical protein VGD34_07760 [Kribbella sp.]|jgi:hypothetical protein
MTLPGARRADKSRLSTPVDKPVRKLWDAPTDTVDEWGNTM